MILDYTRAAVAKIKKDVHNFSIIASIGAQLFAIFSLLYILIKGEGIFAIKLTLLLITAAYFIFYCVTIAYTERYHKQLKRKVAFAFQWSRRIIKLVNLGIVIYGFVGAAHTPLSLLMFTFSAFGVVLDIIIGLLSFVVEGWTQLLVDGVEYDVEKLANTFKPSNLLGKLFGKEEPEPELTPNQKILDKIVQKRREEKIAKDAEMKATKIAVKQSKREEKLAAKAALKQEKREAKVAAKQTKKKVEQIPTPSLLEETAISTDEE